MLRQFLRHPRTQAALAWLLGAYLALVYATTRWTILGEEHLGPTFAPAAGPRRGAIIAFWHERLPVMAQGWRLARHRFPAVVPARTHVLVSRHRDGRFIGEVVRRFGLAMVYASSSRGGATGLRSLLRLVGAEDAVTITPDGPRGPRRQAAPGVAHLAALSGLPVLPCAGRIGKSLQLGSWDRMLVPLPFCRGVLVLGAPLLVPRQAAETSLPVIEAALTAACDAADAFILRGRAA